MRLRLPLKLALLTTLAASGACNFEVGSGDYRVTVTWLINGAAPSPDLCRENGVDRIRFTVLSPGKERIIEADCAESLTLDDGYDYGGFDSTRSFDYGVTYRYSVEMLDSSGRPLRDLAYTDSFKVYYGDYVPWVLDPLELFSPMGNTAAITGEWTLGGHKANAADCSRLGATTVAIDFASSTDPDFTDPVELASADCATGVVTTDRAVVGEGEYNVRYVLLDANDKIIQDIALDEPYFVDRPGTLDVEPVDFDL